MSGRNSLLWICKRELCYDFSCYESSLSLRYSPSIFVMLVIARYWSSVDDGKISLGNNVEGGTHYQSFCIVFGLYSLRTRSWVAKQMCQWTWISNLKRYGVHACNACEVIQSVFGFKFTSATGYGRIISSIVVEWEKSIWFEAIVKTLVGTLAFFIEVPSMGGLPFHAVCGQTCISKTIDRVKKQIPTSMWKYCALCASGHRYPIWSAKAFMRVMRVR